MGGMPPFLQLFQGMRPPTSGAGSRNNITFAFDLKICFISPFSLYFVFDLMIRSCVMVTSSDVEAYL